MRFIYFKNETDLKNEVYEEFEMVAEYQKVLHEKNSSFLNGSYVTEDFSDFLTKFVEEKEQNRIEIKYGNTFLQQYVFTNLKTKAEITIKVLNKWEECDKISFLAVSELSSQLCETKEREDEVLVVGAKQDKRNGHISNKIHVRGSFSIAKKREIEMTIQHLFNNGYSLLCTTTVEMQGYELMEMARNAFLETRNNLLYKLDEDFKKKIKLKT